MRKSAESKAVELGYVLDAAQLRTIDQLAQLASELESACDQPGLLKRIFFKKKPPKGMYPVSYTHLRAHETDSYLVCRCAPLPFGYALRSVAGERAEEPGAPLPQGRRHALYAEQS